MEIFSDMVEKSIEVFMDDFSVIGSTFENCLHNLTFFGTKKVHGNQFSFKLGKVPLYGERRHSIGASHIRERN